MKFFCFGHTNLLATHKTTLEFTRDCELTLKGDCIVGVNSDFSVTDELAELLGCDSLKIIINTGELREIVRAVPNRGFCDPREIVIRKSDFVSDRTLAILADKAAGDLDRAMIELMKSPKQKMEVEIVGEKDTA